MASKEFKPRVVGPNETLVALTTTEAAEQNNRLAELKAMRIVAAKAIDNPMTPPRDLSSLMNRQIAIGREVEALARAAEQEADRAGEVADEGFDAAAI